MQKGFAPILIVLVITIIVAAVGGAYYLGIDHGFEKSVNLQATPAPTTKPESTSSTETANWKTYTSSDYGAQYTFKYPLFWNSEKATEGGGEIFFPSTNHKIYMTIDDVQIEPDATPENLAAKLITADKELIFRKNVIIDKHESVFLEIKSPYDLKIYVLVPDVPGVFRSGTSIESPISKIENVKGTLWITLHVQDGKDLTKEIRSEFDQILSTFKFLDSTQSPAPSIDPAILRDLNKKYISKNSFSIKYPADWIINESDYLNSTTIRNGVGTVSINISEGQYPYGFAGPSDFKVQELKIIVDGKEYMTKEYTRASGAYVDFIVEKGAKSFNILFGSDYPAVNTQNTSLNDYLLNKDTILYILSTFRFTQ